MRSIVHSSRLSRNSISDPVKEDIEEMESEAQLTRSSITDQEVRDEFEALIPNPGYSRGITSLHLKNKDCFCRKSMFLVMHWWKEGKSMRLFS